MQTDTDRITRELARRLKEVDEEVELVRAYRLEYDDDEKAELVRERKDLMRMLERFARPSRSPF